MNKSVFFLLIATILGEVTYAQSDLSETNKLAVTAKIWGFLKYYHPSVAGGKFNWDNELFDVLPKIKNSTSNEQLSQIYIDWIDNLGKVEKCKKCAQDQSLQFFEKNFDLSWITNNRIFTTELIEKLKYIESNRHHGKKTLCVIFKKNWKY